MSPISFADLMAETGTVAVPTSLGPVAVVYQPNALTLAKEAEIQRLAQVAADDEEAEYSLATIFCEIVTSIDIEGPMTDASGTVLTDDDGTPLGAKGELIPLEPEYVVHLSSRFIGRALDAIRDQMRAEEEEQSKPVRPNAKHSRKGSRRGSFTRQR
jgi:hypothetical protein